jgi:hypothetical protein
MEKVTTGYDIHKAGELSVLSDGIREYFTVNSGNRREASYHV